MRVVIAPGSFGPRLPAVEAAQAIAAGWARRAPGDQLTLAPVSDGGEGYVDVLHHALGGELLAVAVSDAYGTPTPSVILVVGATAYVETSQVVGPRAGDPETASSYGVGQLVSAAIQAGAQRVVIGVGARGVACNDGGAGLLAGLGVVSEPAGALRTGPRGLDRLTDLDLASPTTVELLAGIDLVLASDDASPLLGLLGTTSTAGPARGLSAQQVQLVDARLERFAGLAGRKPALLPGAGAGGGIGYGLLLLGAVQVPGLDTVLTEIALAETIYQADLVVTGELAFDLSAGSALTATGVARVAGAAARPCIALAERVAVGTREARALGLESAYAVDDLVPAGGDADPALRLAALAERVARTWSWSH